MICIAVKHSVIGSGSIERRFKPAHSDHKKDLFKHKCAFEEVFFVPIEEIQAQQKSKSGAIPAAV